MAELIQIPDPLQVPKPLPVQVQVPTAQQAASQSIKPNQARSQVHSVDLGATRQAMAAVNENNLRALAGVMPGVSEALNKMQEREFADGFMREMQGTAVSTIADEQLGGSFFGDGAAVRGARASQQMSQAASLDMWVQQNQGDLSRMSLDEQRAAIGEFVGGLSTGDEQADLMTGQMVMQRMPAIMENVARVSFQEQQHQAAVQQADAISAHGKALTYAGSELLAGRLSKDSYAVIKAQAVDSLKPLPGQTNASYRSQMQGALLKHIQDGNFDIANLIQDDILAGSLSPEENLALGSQVKRQRAQWLLDNPTSQDYHEYGMGLPSQISADRYDSKSALSAEIAEVNRIYQSETGSLTPVIDNEQRGRFLGMWDAQQERGKAAAAQADAKLLADNQKRALYLEGYAKGSPSAMQASGLDAATKHSIEQAQVARFYTDPTEASAKVFSKLASQGYTSGPLKESIESTMGLLKSGKTPAPERLQALQVAYQKLESSQYGQGALQTYFGDDLELAQEMAGMDLTDSKNLAQLRIMTESRKVKLSVTPDEMKTAQDHVLNEVNPAWYSRLFGDGRKLGAGYENYLKQNMPQHLATVMKQFPNLSLDSAIQRAHAQTVKNTDQAGDYIVTGSKPGQFLTELNKKMDMAISAKDDSRINALMQDAVASRFPHQQGWDIGGIVLAPTGDRVLMNIVRGDGTPGMVTLTMDQLAEVDRTSRKKIAEANKASAEARQARIDKSTGGFTQYAQESMKE